jgi:chromosome partitioning protein
MRSILILNPKGGSGKSTLATNIAGYFATQGQRVALADCDTQGSSRDWLAVRPAGAPEIVNATLSAGKFTVPRRTDVVVIDTPAATHGKRLAAYVQLSQTLVIPMTPSPIDIRAAEHFIHELYSLRSLINRKVKLATVANRAREDTLVAAKLDHYLDSMRLPGGGKLPYITVLRASQNYINAAEKGLSIFEFAPAKTMYDREQWQPLLRWLNSARSLPS